MFIKVYLIALPILLAIDALWLGIISKSFYQQQIGFLMKSNINWIAAGLLYMVLTLGLVVFVVMPAVQNNSWHQALAFGLLFGIISYAVYDLTNLATIKDWPLIVTIVDMMWGGVLCALVAVASYYITKLF